MDSSLVSLSSVMRITRSSTEGGWGLEKPLKEEDVAGLSSLKGDWFGSLKPLTCSSSAVRMSDLSSLSSTVVSPLKKINFCICNKDENSRVYMTLNEHWKVSEVNPSTTTEHNLQMRKLR